jgi:hypothetical protein
MAANPKERDSNDGERMISFEMKPAIPYHAGFVAHDLSIYFYFEMLLHHYHGVISAFVTERLEESLLLTIW